MSRRRVTDTEQPPEEDRRYVTALARGLDVLRCFRPGQPTMTLSEIAAVTGLPDFQDRIQTQTENEGYVTIPGRDAPTKSS